MEIPKLAILDPNALSLLGLKTLLERIVPEVEICTMSQFDEQQLQAEQPIAHYFVSAQMLVEHTTYFRQRVHQTIVLTNGMLAGVTEFHTLNANCSEKSLVRSLLGLMSHAHGHGEHLPPRPSQQHPCPLSAREIEVLSLIVKGLLNKEIADRLCISLTTVISHRKNIMDKLNLRNVSALTIYAVMNGIVSVEEI